MESFDALTLARIQFAFTVQPRTISAAHRVGIASGMAMFPPSGLNWNAFSEVGVPFLPPRLPNSVTIGELAAPDYSLAFLPVGACGVALQKAGAAAGCH